MKSLNHIKREGQIPRCAYTEEYAKASVSGAIQIFWRSFGYLVGKKTAD